MSGTVLRTRRGFAGPAEDTEAAIAALIDVQAEASRALEDGAIGDDEYEAILARADEIELAIETDPTAAAVDALALRTEVGSTRVAGKTEHRTNVALAMVGAGVASILIVAGLTAWAGAAR